MRKVVIVVSLLAAALALPAGAGAAPQEAKTTKGVTEPNFPDQVVEQYEVPTEHGTMVGWVSRPDPDAYPELYAQGQGTEGPGVPTVLVLSPYNSIYHPVHAAPPTLARAEQAYFTQRGYAYAQFDVVGTRESGGCYDYGGIRERETGAAVIDFLGSRDWSNGNVGMIGGSYDGTTQIAAAIEQPEHLKAIVPQVAIDRWYDYAFGGGVRYFLNSEDPSDEGFDTPFAFDFGFALIPPTSDDAPRNLEVLAERIDPCDRLLHTERAYEPDPVYDEFWDERDYRRSADKVEAAVLLEGGWLDHNVKHWGTTRFYEALPDDHPKKMVIGQWAHAGSQFDDAVDIRHAFFDQWLLGIDTGVMDLPQVDTQTNTGTRYQHEDWPPPGTRRVNVPLTLAPSERDLGLADAEEPSYVGDQTVTEEMALEGQCNGRCLVFITDPLAEPIRISGGPLLRLTATSDKPSTHYTPVLFTETADGERRIITRGFLNAKNHQSLRASTPLTPGEEYRAPVDIWDVDYEIPAGDRLGVAVLSSNIVWALPDDDTVPQGGPATNTLTLGGESYLQLPLSVGADSLTPAEGGGGGGGGGGTPDPDGGGGGVGEEGDVVEGGGAPTLPATGGGACLLAVLGLGLGALTLHRLRRP